MKKIRQYVSLPHVRPYPFKFILASLSRLGTLSWIETASKRQIEIGKRPTRLSERSAQTAARKRRTTATAAATGADARSSPAPEQLSLFR